MEPKLPRWMLCWNMNVYLVVFCFMMNLQLAAQTKIEQQHTGCEHSSLNPLFHWQEVKIALAKKLDITSTEAAYFIKYLTLKKQLGYTEEELLKQAHTGELNKTNALSFWMNKIPAYTQLYTDQKNNKEYIDFISAQKKLNREPIPYTGGADCNNLDFSNGTTSGWKGTWNSTGERDPNNNWYGLNGTIGLNSSSSFNYIYSAHQLCTTGMDRNVPINRVPANHTYSLRLGNDSASRSSSGAYNHQTISNTFTVTAQNNSLVYWYAVVFDQSSGIAHAATEQPYFKIRMYVGGTEISCAHYDVNCTEAATIGGFQHQAGWSTYAPSLSYECYYKDWTPVMIPLIDFMGKQVTITFETSDCNAIRHFGYAYLTTDCTPYNLILSTPFPCTGGTAQLTAPLGAATYLWTGPGIVGPNNTSSITINSAGHYSVSMTTLGSQGANCTFTLDTTIIASGSSPFASFTTSSNACLSVPTTFTNTSTGSPVSWKWTFGDGQSDNINKNPVHTYSAPGTYTAVLYTTNAGGCTDSASRTIIVYPNPKASFTSSLVCEGAATVFDNSASTIVPPDHITSYDWDFGDKKNFSGANPQHVYSACGTYPVTLTITSNHNCTSTITQNVVVNCKPVIDFTANNNTCLSLPTIFTSTGIPTLSAWTWNFGDSGTDVLNQNPVHTYGASGTYTISLIASAPGGCADTAIHTVTIHPNPVANFTANTPCQGTATLFNSSTSAIASPDNIVFYNWTFGDNQNFSGPDPAHLYNQCGTYPVNLVLVSNHNCTSSYSDSVHVNCKPIADFSVPAVCIGNNSVFKDLSFSSDGTISSWCWDLDGNPATCELPNAPGPLNYIIPVAGTKEVTLTVTSSKNCIATITHMITIHPKPVADFSSPAVCAGSVSVFNDQTTIASGSISSWNWNFNNSSIPNSKASSPSVVFPSTGKQLVQLTVTSDQGCVDDTIIPITIHPNPVPLISVDDPDGCPVHHANFSGIVTPASVDHAKSIAKWQWDMDNNGSFDYTHTYTPGTDADSAAYDYDNADHLLPRHYSLSLTVTSDDGCMGKVTTNEAFITVFPQPVAAFSASSTEGSSEFMFTDQSVGANSYSWNFGDAFVKDPLLNVSIKPNPTHLYENETSNMYIVTQWVVNKYSCRDSISHPVETVPFWTFYIPNAFTPNSDGHNEGFRGRGMNIHSYNLWIFDRWGNRVFYSDNLDENWNGIVQGQGSGEVVQQDVYVWKAKFKDVFNKSHERTGTVTVIK
jgi:gliding motility-associated-like protein